MTDDQYFDHNQLVLNCLKNRCGKHNIMVSYTPSMYNSTYFEVDCYDQEDEHIKGFIIRVSDHPRNANNGPVDFDLPRNDDLEFWLEAAMDEIIEQVFAEGLVMQWS